MVAYLSPTYVVKGYIRQKFEKHWPRQRIQAHAVHVKTGQLLWEQIFGRLIHDVRFFLCVCVKIMFFKRDVTLKSDSETFQDSEFMRVS